MTDRKMSLSLTRTDVDTAMGDPLYSALSELESNIPDWVTLTLTVEMTKEDEPPREVVEDAIVNLEGGKR